MRYHSCFVAIILLALLISSPATVGQSVDSAGPAVPTERDSEEHDHEPSGSTHFPDSEMQPTSSALLPVYCLLIVAASLFGGWLPSLIRLTHTRMQTVVSFVGGLMLGIAVFHLWPHASHQLDSDSVAMWIMCGILLMFFLIRTFHFHDHGIAEDSHDDDCDPCDHEHHHSHGHSQQYELSWIGILTGLSVHTLLDGIALGAAVTGPTATTSVLPGFGVFLAIVLHKPLDAVSITSLMATGGWQRNRIQAVNAAFAMMCPLGAALVVVGSSWLPALQNELAGAALAFSAGVFLCIALSDLLPEMEFHSHHRLRLSIALVLGIAIAWGMRFLEPGHFHS